MNSNVDDRDATNLDVEMYLSKFDEWRNKCPLKLMLEKHNISMRTFASILRVTHVTVKNWTNGSFYPKAEYIKVFEKMGLTEAEYKEWFDSKPEIMEE